MTFFLNSSATDRMLRSNVDHRSGALAGLRRISKNGKSRGEQKPWNLKLGKEKHSNVYNCGGDKTGNFSLLYHRRRWHSTTFPGHFENSR
jgi:hypothetical protein